MVRSSGALNIDLNLRPEQMSIPGYFSYVSTLDDNPEKVEKLQHFLRCLENEQQQTAATQHQLFSYMQFLRNATSRVRHEKTKVDIQLTLKERLQRDNNFVKNKEARDETTLTYEDDKQTHNMFNNTLQESVKPMPLNVEPISYDVEPISYAPVHNDNSALAQPLIRPKHNESDLDVVVKQTEKRRRVWSEDLHNRFMHVVETLGGPREATPKQVQDLMQVADLSREQIKSYLQRTRSQFRSTTCSHSTSTSSACWTTRSP